MSIGLWHSTRMADVSRQGSTDAHDEAERGGRRLCLDCANSWFDDEDESEESD
jgi:hypothetical protein